MTKLFGLFGLLASLWSSSVVPASAQDGTQVSDDVQQIWEDYFDRIKSRRLAEAKIMWSEMISQGVSSNTALVLDFRIFCSIELGAVGLQEQLTDSYSIRLEYERGKSIWFIDGTTRPTGVVLEEPEYLAWIGFMADVAAQNGCVFTTWSIEAPELGAIFDSEVIEVELP